MTGPHYIDYKVTPGMIQTKEGHWILRNDTHISRWVEETGRLDHDTGFIEWIKAQGIPPDGTIVEIGAFIGDHTVALLEQIVPQGKVISYEPGGETFQCLRLNTEKHRDRSDVRNKAVWSTGQDMRSFQHENRGASHLMPANDLDEGTIQAVALDRDLMGIDRIDRIDAIIMDAEGAEPHILAGASHLISIHQPKIFSEFNNGALQRMGFQAGNMDLEGLLIYMGYKATDAYPKDSSIFEEQMDAVFVPDYAPFIISIPRDMNAAEKLDSIACFDAPTGFVMHLAAIWRGRMLYDYRSSLGQRDGLMALFSETTCPQSMISIEESVKDQKDGSHDLVVVGYAEWLCIPTIGKISRMRKPEGKAIFCMDTADEEKAARLEETLSGMAKDMGSTIQKFRANDKMAFIV